MSHSGGSHGGHPPYLQHHFDTPEQQYDSGKLGMWLFLATEVLLFGGLFCAYAVYRGNHPEIFDYAHTFLDTNLGAINTVILLTSSLTMAWAVRASQLGQQRLMLLLLGLTLTGGLGFMGIKYVEYKAKWEHGLLWGLNYDPAEHGGAAHGGAADDHGGDSATGAGHGNDPGGTADHGNPAGEAIADAQAAAGHGDDGGAAAVADPAAAGVLEVTAAGLKIEKTTMPDAAAGPAGTVLAAPGGERPDDHPPEPRNVQIFFGIYFLMTGLHGLHVLAGMGAIAWVMFRAAGGRFGPDYFTPVDLVGLYWHLVDLIWIFLFPLLYLIR